MLRPDPRALAEAQLARDRAATARFPGLLERKLARMAVSPLAYLRGTAPLFHEILAQHPELGEGPAGEGWLCGDAHLENFGVFKAERGPEEASEKEPVVFDVNDFDEGIIGPFRLDALRLVTSLILGGRELGASGKESIALSHHLLEGYAAASFDGALAAVAPTPVRRLLEKVDERSHRDLLDRRTEVVKGKRRFVMGERYMALPSDLAEGSRAAFGEYARAREREGARHGAERFEVLDVAFRIAGNGSLGTLRVAVLTRGKGGPDGAWLFDMKEEGTPSAAVLLASPSLPPAERVLSAVRACLADRPRMLGVTTLQGMSMLVRRLAPQEDKLALARLKREDLPALAAFLGTLLGRAHHRGATSPPSRPWPEEQRSALIDSAIVMAGAHEACYLAMCKAP